MASPACELHADVCQSIKKNLAKLEMRPPVGSCTEGMSTSSTGPRHEGSGFAMLNSPDPQRLRRSGEPSPVRPCAPAPNEWEHAVQYARHNLQKLQTSASGFAASGRQRPVPRPISELESMAFSDEAKYYLHSLAQVTPDHLRAGPSALPDLTAEAVQQTIDQVDSAVLDHSHHSLAQSRCSPEEMQDSKPTGDDHLSGNQITPVAKVDRRLSFEDDEAASYSETKDLVQQLHRLRAACEKQSAEIADCKQEVAQLEAEAAESARMAGADVEGHLLEEWYHKQQGLLEDTFEWDYVIVMDGHGSADRPVTREEATDLFRSAFQSEARMTEAKNCQDDRSDFLRSFQNLRPFGGHRLFGRRDSGGGSSQPTSPRSWCYSSNAGAEVSGMDCDFRTLLRKTIIMKLVHHAGLHVETVPSGDGRYIYVLVAATAATLREHAERIGYHLLLDLRTSDIGSLEPCDANFVPLVDRFFALQNEHVRDAYKEFVHELQNQDREEVDQSIVDYHTGRLSELNERYFVNAESCNSGVATPRVKTPRLDHVSKDSAVQQTVHSARVAKTAATAQMHRVSSTAGKAVEHLNAGYGGRKSQDRDCNQRAAYSPLARGGGVAPNSPRAATAGSDEQHRSMNQGSLALESLYIAYLQKRIAYLKNGAIGFGAYQAIKETNKDFRHQACCLRPPQLQCLWDWLRFHLPPLGVNVPYDRSIPAQKWMQYTGKTLGGNEVSTCFSPTNRLVLLHDLINQQVDLMHLIKMNLVVAYFPMPSSALRDYAFLGSKQVMKQQLRPSSLGTAPYMPRRPLPHLLVHLLQKFRLVHCARRRRLARFGRLVSTDSYSWLSAMMVQPRMPRCLRCCRVTWLFGSSIAMFRTRLEHTYFGDKIGTYFLFLRCYTRWLLLLGILGSCFQCAALALDSIATKWCVLAYVIVLVVWARRLPVNWQTVWRQQMLQRGSDTAGQVQYAGARLQTSIMVEDMNYSLSYRGHVARQGVSMALSSLVLLITLMVVGAMSVGRTNLHVLFFKAISVRYSAIVLAVCQCLFVLGVDRLYGKLAVGLSLWEKYKNHDQFAHACLMKSLLFSYFNRFASLFYVLFVQHYIEVEFLALEELCSDSWQQCMLDEVRCQIIVFILVPQLCASCALLVSFCTAPRRTVTGVAPSNEQAGCSASMHLTYKLDTYMKKRLYGPVWLWYDGTEFAYLELDIMFGYLLLFSVVLPGVSILVLFVCVLKLHGDSFKLRSIVRRPIPQDQPILCWKGVFPLLLGAAVLSNSFLLVLSVGSTPLDHISRSPSVSSRSQRLVAGFSYAALIFIVSVLAEMLPNLSGHSGDTAERRMQHVADLVRWPLKPSPPAAHSEVYHAMKLRQPWEPVWNPQRTTAGVASSASCRAKYTAADEADHGTDPPSRSRPRSPPCGGRGPSLGHGHWRRGFAQDQRITLSRPRNMLR